MLSIRTALAAIALPLLASPAQHVRSVLNNSKARVLLVEIPAGGNYLMDAPTARGSVWVAINSLRLTLTGSLPKSGFREISLGEAGTLTSGMSAEFRNARQTVGRLVVIDIKRSLNVVMPEVLDLKPGKSAEQATPDDGTVLVAISSLKLKELLEVGEPDAPVPGPSYLVSMHPGDVRWLEPGMREFTNLLGTPVRFVLVGW